MTDWTFYRGKKILITGHTGFKGSWMCRFLLEAGAHITGYALKPPTVPNMYELCGINKEVDSVEGDIRDISRLQQTFDRVKPELAVHMAAQPIVREGYHSPVYTYEVNVMGTVNVLECIRNCESVKSFVNVTTDKVYRNNEWEWGYRETEELNGYDPYSNSKSCSELVTDSYRNSFFSADNGRKTAISTVRAGNVIGGGDFAVDRIVPDMVRAAQNDKEVLLRNPYSVRPYQHVLDPVAAYLMILKGQYENPELAGSYNVGPNEDDCMETQKLAALFCEEWKKCTGKSLGWNTLDSVNLSEPHEADYLKLDCSKLKKFFSWKPCWNADKTIAKTAEWYAEYICGGNLRQCTDRQIKEFSGEWQEKGN